MFAASARDSAFAPAGVKLLEIDPRSRGEGWKDVDQRCRLIASATLKAVKLEAARRKSALESALAQG